MNGEFNKRVAAYVWVRPFAAGKVADVPADKDIYLVDELGSANIIPVFGDTTEDPHETTFTPHPRSFRVGRLVDQLSNGNELTESGERYCRIWGLEHSVHALKSWTLCHPSDSIRYEGYEDYRGRVVIEKQNASPAPALATA